MSAAEWIIRRDGIRLAVRQRAGRGPTIIFLPGYMSDMTGSKALALDEWAHAQGRALLRLDYSGCGESEGRFADGTLDIWRDDVLQIIDARVRGPVLLVGSSMGGWLALLLALALGERVIGMVGIAPAPDFTDWGFDDGEKAALQRDGRVTRASEYGLDPLLTTLGFWRSGEANRLLDREIDIRCPVRLIHGQQDPDVPWRISLDIAARLRSADVQTLLVKDGDHRLSRERDIALMLGLIGQLLETS